MQFRICNIDFEISYLLLCLVVTYASFDKTGLYIPIIVSVMIHEFSHLAFILFFKGKIKAVKLILGAISVEYIDFCSTSKKIIALLAGPLSNLVTAIGSLVLGFKVMFSVNIAISLYNMLPVKGLDGGSILYELISHFTEEIYANTVINVFTLFILILGIFLCYNLYITNISVIIIALYIITPLIFKKTLKDTRI